MHKRILFTGGSGNLGQAIIKSGIFSDILFPSHEEMDISDEKKIAAFFEKNNPDAVIHCAALVDMKEVEKNPEKALNINVLGTANLIEEIVRRERRDGKNIRFIYISTDGVYSCTRGNYSEGDETIPYNNYGWNKLGGECVTHALSNFCIIRTSFFDPQNIKHEFYATDKYSSRLPISYLPKAIKFLLESNFIGTINIGGKKESDYEKYKKIKPDIKPTTHEDIAKKSPIKISRDSSLDSSLWRELTKGVKDLEIND